MTFSDIYGRDQLVSSLKAMADSGRVPHAMLLYEDDGGGAIALILAFIDYLNGEKPSDIHYTFPITTGSKVSGKVESLTCDLFAPYWNELLKENPYFLEQELGTALGFERKTGGISAAEGRSILRTLSLNTMTNGYRAVVMYLPERMNAATANMLLKNIEEPSPGDLFLMVTHAPEDVLQTITSRCQAMRLPPLPKHVVSRVLQERFGCSADEAAEAVENCGGSVGKALHEVRVQGEGLALRDLFSDLLDCIVRGDYLGTLDRAEAVAGLDSREKQKGFCTFAAESLRKVFMLQNRMDSISGVPPSMMDYYKRLAKALPSSFCATALRALDTTAERVERNVNQKVLFCNLANKFWLAFTGGRR